MRGGEGMGKGWWLNAGALPTRWQANKKRQQLHFLVSACWGSTTHRAHTKQETFFGVSGLHF